MKNRREFLLGCITLIGTALGGPVWVTGPARAQQRVPNMPARNPWLADSGLPHIAFQSRRDRFCAVPGAGEWPQAFIV
jgi:hypothetical protein